MDNETDAAAKNPTEHDFDGLDFSQNDNDNYRRIVAICTVIAIVVSTITAMLCAI